MILARPARSWSLPTSTRWSPLLSLLLFPFSLSSLWSVPVSRPSLPILIRLGSSSWHPLCTLDTPTPSFPVSGVQQAQTQVCPVLPHRVGPWSHPAWSPPGARMMRMEMWTTLQARSRHQITSHIYSFFRATKVVAFSDLVTANIILLLSSVLVKCNGMVWIRYNKETDNLPMFNGLYTAANQLKNGVLSSSKWRQDRYSNIDYNCRLL